VNHPIASDGLVSSIATGVLPPLEPRPPHWLDDLFGSELQRFDERGALQTIGRGPLTLLTTRVPLARTFGAADFKSSVTDAYLTLGAALASSNRTPIRFWNFVPGVDDVMGAGLDRYMVFNAGRYDAFRDWYHLADNGGRFLSTASAVGYHGRDFVLYCLASSSRGEPVENPRQKPAWKYSTKYGPMPPCFSRATVAEIDGQARLLIGGTASILGEDSVHVADIGAQVAETLRNLTALVNAARDRHEPQATALDRLRDLRAYVRNPDHADVIRRELASGCPSATRVELVHARICRPELLVEIEAVAAI
jgi:chorismate lyase/3-hydroxybenzoate synthase